MRINHNLMAMNTYRQLGINNANMSKSIEKLSSGLRINRAGDDAAGLAISEKMRAQIKGLNQASRNAQDGISMIQTAEGALQETESILQRMRELSVQASNGTATNDDRGAIQDEIEQLKSEIDRIGNSTEFNTKKLLNGDMAGDATTVIGENVTTGALSMSLETASQISTNNIKQDATSIDFTTAAHQKETITIDGHDIEVDWMKHLTDAERSALDADNSGATVEEVADIVESLEDAINAAIDEYNETNAAGAKVSHINLYENGGKLVIESGIKGEESEITFTPGGANSVLDLYLGDGSNGTITKSGDAKVDFTLAGTETLTFKIGDVTLKTGTLAAATAGTTSGDTVASDIQTKINNAISTYNTNAGLSAGDEGFIEDVTVDAKDGKLVISSPSGSISFVEQDGDSTLEDMGLTNVQTEAAAQGAVSLQIGANRGQTMSFGISDMRSAALGVNTVDVSTESGASMAIDDIDAAIKKVSEQRSALGAYQNRLEHSIKNLDTSSENLTAAESRIRDVDMAKEMMEQSKNSILSQAAQAMLAQAKQAPQGVLQLLR
ncbi:flagellin N-terminal helical domain-containing protein [Tepidibacter formicigenes]|jgi:flagellin|uniref:Flagellin n=1 Tax=Tepidibacter formicigenes DSM 15518 TaxID=1123349 RepID=A0A1M6NZB0_9FIRM|nr:flagellin [Tepidibacter formicigenes]SHK01067.1 flagellin [Tepidibacter formicigenes DSM 15518]